MARSCNVLSGSTFLRLASLFRRINTGLLFASSRQGPGDPFRIDVMACCRFDARLMMASFSQGDPVPFSVSSSRDRETEETGPTQRVVDRLRRLLPPCPDDDARRHRPRKKTPGSFNFRRCLGRGRKACWRLRALVTRREDFRLRCAGYNRLPVTCQRQQRHQRDHQRKVVRCAFTGFHLRNAAAPRQSVLSHGRH